ncbi:glycosyltransferase [Chryseobacterium sp. BIGb0232]|uniref:glycosyltransferase n=1 Tax=Chryseobacterium sp. BIGb0232 TaxID=2940598 RepID=UPI000FA4B3C3|nr:glycosyltransferase [Chryseobacterium sp. BIGb0232]MCS4303834.1 glycosyltransferase involved in cell wall biosynthesis [Chryseobacterium sp. BIGb0232]ROS11627.1 glycosyltransferase involved in cell wall biosynthesis [Chryseobacterium nakagawai]
MKKKVLYFMPDNPMSGKAGNTTRLNYMLSYFNENKALDVTFVSLRDWGMWKKEEEILFHEKFPNIQLHLLDKKYKKSFFKYLFLYKIPYLFKINSIDTTSYILRKEFSEIIKKSAFDIVLISYATWGRLVNEVSAGTCKIIDTHDFITAQSRHKRNVGKLFQDEISILKQYDNIWTYSVEEEYIFDQFTNKKVTLMPVSFPENFSEKKQEFKYDIIYVASDNPHNINGIQWFLKEVLPLLNNVKIHIIGKIGKAIAEDYPNVVKYGMVDDLQEFYSHARVAICPMMSGTGVKIKVLEALSYGLPVVTNRRGVDGLINKKNNGCLVSQDPVEFSESIHQLMNDDVFYEKVKKQAICYFKENHNSKIEKEILDSIFL